MCVCFLYFLSLSYLPPLWLGGLAVISPVSNYPCCILGVFTLRAPSPLCWFVCCSPQFDPVSLFVSLVLFATPVLFLCFLLCTGACLDLYLPVLALTVFLWSPLGVRILYFLYVSLHYLSSSIGFCLHLAPKNLRIIIYWKIILIINIALFVWSVWIWFQNLLPYSFVWDSSSGKSNFMCPVWYSSIC